jgi:hypothetical protein
MKTFTDLMFEALEDTLRLVLGENISNLIHSFTKSQSELKLKEISNNINDIIAYLEKLLGKEGAQIIQIISIKRLFLKLKQEYEEVEAHFLLLDELYKMKFELLVPLINRKTANHN